MAMLDSGGIILVKFDLLFCSRAGGGGPGGGLSGAVGPGTFTGLGMFEIGGVQFV